MLYKDISHEIIGLAMKVQNRYGAGHNERIYQKALEEEFELKNIKYYSQPRLPVFSLQTGKKLGWYQPDLLVAEKIIIELKATPYTAPRFSEQIEQYLMTSDICIGYLINFTIKPLYFRHFINTKAPIKEEAL